ncbi:MAG TPA: hypothetical protein VNS12_06410 [Pelagibacterium sp.]|uniref:hypothetical protein n=1 Tax=Pelagibacterium sp. TaxID=1967288 RepID=UPI002BF54299|nr:hypothetical protein [Pelagibacterium sp.]HWJ87684.1 hypothetical protein [Pelagibacterium sp.]
MRLIFNVRDWDGERREITVSLVNADAADIAADFQGERVALGTSPSPGWWVVWGEGVLAGHRNQNDATSFLITDVAALSRLHSMKRGDPGDSSKIPYGLDVLEPEEAGAIFGDLSLYRQIDSPRAAAAEQSESGWNHFRFAGPENRLAATVFGRLRSAYNERCAFIGVWQAPANGQIGEGMTVAVDAGAHLESEALSMSLFVSNMVGPLYQSGRLAIGEEYGILYHPDLDASVALAIEAKNPTGKLILPQDRNAWPDLEAARRHRERFGY